MNTHPALEKTPAYLNVQLGDTRPGWSSSPEGPFVTLSRESGAGGSSLAAILADLLSHEQPGSPPWRVIDSDLIDRMLETNGLEPRLARFLPEDSVSELNASVGELVGLHPSLWELIRKTHDLMREVARAGHAILVGRGANFATSSVPNGLHLRLVASPHHRAAAMARRQGMDIAEAMEFNRRQDAARSRYVRSTFNADVTSPGGYDLVINTTTIPLTQAAEMVAALVRSRAPATA